MSSEATAPEYRSDLTEPEIFSLWCDYRVQKPLWVDSWNEIHRIYRARYEEAEFQEAYESHQSGLWQYVDRFFLPKVFTTMGWNPRSPNYDPHVSAERSRLRSKIFFDMLLYYHHHLRDDADWGGDEN